MLHVFMRFHTYSPRSLRVVAGVGLLVALLGAFIGCHKADLHQALRQNVRPAEGSPANAPVAKPGEFEAPASLCQIGSRPFDVAPDGQRFLELTPLERTEASPMVLLTNWEAVLDGSRK